MITVFNVIFLYVKKKKFLSDDQNKMTLLKKVAYSVFRTEYIF